MFPMRPVRLNGFTTGTDYDKDKHGLISATERECRVWKICLDRRRIGAKIIDNTGVLVICVERSRTFSLSACSGPVNIQSLDPSENVIPSGWLVCSTRSATFIYLPFSFSPGRSLNYTSFARCKLLKRKIPFLINDRSRGYENDRVCWNLSTIIIMKKKKRKEEKDHAWSSSD